MSKRKQPAAPTVPKIHRIKFHATCEFFATFEATCPLCRKVVEAGTRHRCKRTAAAK